MERVIENNIPIKNEICKSSVCQIRDTKVLYCNTESIAGRQPTWAQESFCSHSDITCSALRNSTLALFCQSSQFITQILFLWLWQTAWGLVAAVTASLSTSKVIMVYFDRFYCKGLFKRLHDYLFTLFRNCNNLPIYNHQKQFTI